MRVAVVFFGIARGLELAIRNIRRNLYNCNPGEDFDFYTIASLNIPRALHNPRGDEIDIALNPADAFMLNADFYALARQDDATIAEPLAIARRQSDDFQNGWSSVRNILHQLASLQRAWATIAEISGRKFDYILFARPDLLYLDEIRIADATAEFQGEGSIALPAWHSWGGFNDRFALADPTAARHYAERLRLVPEYCARQPLHPERLLAYALAKGGCRVCRLPVRARRIRANGTIKNEDFELATIPLPRRSFPFSYPSVTDLFSL